MSLEASVHAVRELVKTFQGVIAIGDALETALAAEQKAAAADRRTVAAIAAVAEAEAKRVAVVEACELTKVSAAKLLTDAQRDAADIRKEAKSKADVTVAKAKDKSDAMDEAVATAREKFNVQKQTNDEILAMANAQIAHAETKLSEIRAAIAKITGG